MTQSAAVLIEAAGVILEADPPMTITQLFLRLVSLPSDAPGHISNTNLSYANFVRLMARARLERDSRINWRRIVESTDATAPGLIVETNLDERNKI